MKPWFKRLIFVNMLCLVALMIINQHIKNIGKHNMLTPTDAFHAQAAMVLGAYVSPEGDLCDMLRDRVETAVDLYKKGRVDKLLMTGDHGRAAYDEVNHMRRYAEELGVPAEDIFMDHAGFSTYDSMYRSRDVFHVESAIIVTQNFHLPRAIYIARILGIDAKGFSADRRLYQGVEYNEFREVLARNKDFINVQVIQSRPKFLGTVISITGDGRQTRD